MQKNIALIYGDCASPEIVAQAVRVLDKIAAKHGHTFTYTRAYMGGEAIANGDTVAIDFDTGVITDETTGQTFQAAPFPPFIQKIIAAGGLMNSLQGNA